MAEYTVKDEESGKTIVFNWDSPDQPTDTDFEDVFKEARKFESEKGKSEVQPLAGPEKTELIETPGIGEQIADYLPFAGGIAGGVPATIAPWLRPITAGAGGIVGEMARQTYQRIVGSESQPKSLKSSLYRMGVQGVTQGVGQIGGEAMLYGGGKIFPHVAEKYIQKDVQEAGKDLITYMEKYLPKTPITARMIGQRREQGFLPGQIAEEYSKIGTFQNILEKSLLGRGPIRRFEYAQEKAAKDYADMVVNTFWGGTEKLGPTVRGEGFLSAFKAGEDLFYKQSGKNYETLGKMLPDDKIVSLTQLKNEFTIIAEKNVEKAGIGASQTGDALVNKINSLPDKMSFANAHDLRSRLLKEEWTLENKDVAHGLAAKAAKSVDTAMENAGKNLSGDSLTAWRQANAFHKAGIEKFENDFIQKLITKGKSSPEIIGPSIFQNFRPSQIDKAQQIATSKIWNDLKAGYVEDGIKKATNPVSGEVSYSKLNSFVKNMGEENYNKVFNLQEQAILNKLSTIQTTVQGTGAGAGGGGGGMLIQLMQAGAIGGLLTGAYFSEQNRSALLGGVGILASPYVFSKIFVHPVYQRWLLEGMKPGIPTRQAITNISRLISTAIQLNKEGETKRKQQEAFGEQEIRKETGLYR